MSCSFLVTRCESDSEGERFAIIFYTQEYFNLGYTQILLFGKYLRKSERPA